MSPPTQYRLFVYNDYGIMEEIFEIRHSLNNFVNDINATKINQYVIPVIKNYKVYILEDLHLL